MLGVDHPELVEMQETETACRRIRLRTMNDKVSYAQDAKTFRVLTASNNIYLRTLGPCFR